MRAVPKWLSRLGRTAPGEAAIVVEANSPALTTRTHVAEAVGIETAGGTLSPILKRGRRLPCSATFMLTTVTNGQSEISIALYRGNVARVDSAHRIGAFRIEGIPPAPKGVPVVKARLASHETSLLLEACDEKSGHRLTIVR